MRDAPTEWQTTVSHDFMKDAACRGLDPNMFMPGVGETGKEAKLVCNGIPATRNDPGKPPCPVKDKCLEYALQIPPPVFGVWGGLNERQRRRLARNEPEPIKIKRFHHGTDAGYQQHRLSKTKVCQACADAHAEAARAWRDKQRDNVSMPALRQLLTIVHEANASSRNP